MAVRDYTKTAVAGGGYLVEWSGLLNGDTGQPFEGSAGDRSIHFSGTFGAGGTVKMRGSNTGTNYLDLTDPQGNAISKTAEGVEAISENTRYMRPEVTAGDGDTALKASMFVRG